MQVIRTAQRLARLAAQRAHPHVMHDDLGDTELPLKATEVRQQHACVCRAVLVAAVQAKQWVEDQQPRLDLV